MAAIQDILAGVDLNQLARALGADPHDVQNAASTAVSSLVQGVEHNVEAEDGAISLANALGQHLDNDNAAPQTGAIDLSRLDFEDGAKIVNHIIPAGQQQQLFGGAQGTLVQKLMPLLAPIVMAYLAKKLQSSGGLGSVLGGVLGGQAAQSPAGGGMGDVLGQILGGGQASRQAQQQHGGIGDILGQILGGGAPAAPQAPAYNEPARDGGLRMDPGNDPRYDQPVAGQGQPSLGGLLKSILFG